MKETEMYQPLKKLLTKQGYLVRSEVEGVDVMARKEKELLIVEMKVSFNMQLVYQLIERLKLTDQVYAYVPLKKGGRWAKSYKKMCGLLRRLNCGLMTLDAPTKKKVVIEFEPAPFQGRTNYAKKKLAVKEFEGRSEDLNEGGSTKEPLFTVYKEKVIRIAMYLYENGTSSTRVIKKETGIENTTQILYQNHQSWFNRVERGTYQVTPEFEFFRLKYEKKLKKLT